MSSADNNPDSGQMTRRAVVPALETMLYEPIPVLDKGFIRVIDYMGNDAAIVQAARVSYGSGTKHVSQDKGLIRYLMRHHHTTPFEMCEIKLHVKLPIFIARQWIRHRTANVNEYSARYSILDKEFYLPAPENLATQSTVNGQGRGAILENKEAQRILEIIKTDSELCYSHYLEMLNIDEANQILNSDRPQPGTEIRKSQPGIARELARMNLTLNYYTQWYWKIDLHNLLHFLMLRADPHAQLEIREYSNIILNIVEKWVPFTYEAFRDYRLQAVTLSMPMVKCVCRLIKGEKILPENSGLTPREWREFQAKFLDMDDVI